MITEQAEAIQKQWEAQRQELIDTIMALEIENRSYEKVIASQDESIVSYRSELGRLRELLKKSYANYDDIPYQIGTEEIDRLYSHYGGMYRWDDQAIDDAR